jgi:hypothetical protein
MKLLYISSKNEDHPASKIKLHTPLQEIIGTNHRELYTQHIVSVLSRSALGRDLGEHLLLHPDLVAPFPVFMCGENVIYP